jgi:hypothetical protein
MSNVRPQENGMFLRTVCFVSGFMLYNVVVVYVGGFLAAVAIPRAYFEWFGQNKTLALVLEEAAVYALPVFVMCTAWSYVTARAFRRASGRAAKWMLYGFAAAWVSWLAVIAPSLLPTPPSAWSIAAAMSALIIPPVWGVLNLVAGPLGVAVAGVLASWSNPSIERTA